MISSEQVQALLPRLRRYARAMSGSQMIGDELVAQALQDCPLAECQSPRHVRIEMLKYISRRYSGLYSENLGPATTPSRDSCITDRLLTLSQLSRKALLLVSMEELSRDTAAEVLEVPRALIDELLVSAKREIAALAATEVLIIEDEILLAMELEKLVIEMGHRVTGSARTYKAAIASARARPPGLVLADIHLADSSNGIDAANDIQSESEKVPVIFVTAYPERLLTGRRPEPTYLVAKPYKPNDLQVVMAQALLRAPARERSMAG